MYSGVFPPLLPRKVRFLAELKSAFGLGQYIRSSFEVYVVYVYFKVICSILMPEKSHKPNLLCSQGARQWGFLCS